MKSSGGTHGHGHGHGHGGNRNRDANSTDYRDIEKLERMRGSNKDTSSSEEERRRAASSMQLAPRKLVVAAWFGRLALQARLS
jgi:hypothetical protein